MGRIQSTKPEVLEAIKRKSAFSLPNNPGGKGYKPEDIRKALYLPFLDKEKSFRSELERIINEANVLFKDSFSCVDIVSEDTESSG